MRSTVVVKSDHFERVFFCAYACLFFVTPLLMLPITSELFEFNKMLFIYLTTVVVLVAWTVRMIWYRKIILKRSLFDIFFILFLLSQLLSTIFSIDRHTSFFGYYGRFNGGLLSVISYIILYYAFVSNISLDKKKAHRMVMLLLKISLFSSFIVMLWGIPGKFGGDLSCLVFAGDFSNTCWTEQFRPAERMFLTIGQPNWLGAYLAIHFFIGLYFLLKSNIFSFPFFASGVYFILNFSSILFTRSRSSLIAVVFASLIFSVYIIINTIRTRRLLRVKICAIILFLELVGLAIVYMPFSAKVTTPEAPEIQVTESFDIRKIVWRGAIDLGLRYPLFGSGVETFAYAYNFVKPREHNVTSEWDFIYNKAHNEYLNYFATTGFIGVITYILMIGIICMVFVSKIFNFKFLIFKKDVNRQLTITNQQLLICLLLSYVTILITNFFVFSTTTINIYFYLIPAFFVSIAQESEQIDRRKDKDKTSRFYDVWYALPLVVGVGGIFFVSTYFIADMYYAKGISAERTHDYQNAAGYLTTALSYKNEHVYEDKLSRVLANNVVESFFATNGKNTNDREDVIGRLMTLAQHYNNTSLKKSPMNALYLKTSVLNHATFFQITGDEKQSAIALEALDKVLYLSPTDPRLPYLKAVIFSLRISQEKDKKKIEKYRIDMIKFLDQAIVLKKNYRDAYFLKATTLKAMGKLQEAQEIFMYILENINPNDEEVKSEIKV